MDLSEEDLKRMGDRYHHRDDIRCSVEWLVRRLFGRDSVEQRDMTLTIDGITTLLQAAEYSWQQRRQRKGETE